MVKVLKWKRRVAEFTAVAKKRSFRVLLLFGGERGGEVEEYCYWKSCHSQKFRTMSGVIYVATFNAVIGSRLFRKQVTLVPLPTSKL